MWPVNHMLPAQHYPLAGVAMHKELLASMFCALVPDALTFLRKTLHETVATVNNNLVASCFNIMDALLMPWRRDAGELQRQ